MKLKWWILFFLVGLIYSCTSLEENTDGIHRFSGATMGTIQYNITYIGKENTRQLKTEVDSLLDAILAEVSTYEKGSMISAFNRSEDLIFEIGSMQEHMHFVSNFVLSQEVYDRTDRLFDPTVMPLVNHWGFGYEKHLRGPDPDDKKIDSLLQYVGFHKVRIRHQKNNPDTCYLSKKKAGIQLDFSAVAKGYAVDKVAQHLIQNNYSDVYVEIGGELFANGDKNGTPWIVGINTPSPDASLTDFEQLLQIKDAAVATSGNYRNFIEKDGKKYVHTINPKTGYPEISTLLSATIISSDCSTADAYATACMVGGLKKSMEWVEAHERLEGFFVYSDEQGEMKTRYTSGFEKYMVE